MKLHLKIMTQHTSSFLRTINQSPTMLDTVQEVLRQAGVKYERIGFRSADVVLDHAIYAKAFEILQSQPAEVFCKKKCS